MDQLRLGGERGSIVPLHSQRIPRREAVPMRGD